MTYQEFNQRVFDFYMARAEGDYCHLSLDDHDILQITGNIDIPVFSDLVDTWQPLLKRDQGIPSYFGLIGIQCHAAFIMQEDQDHSARAYKGRLMQLLGLSNIHEVQRLFSAGSKDLSVQEEIWMAVQKYFKKELGLSLEIPGPRKYAGRYTQYPTSQCLLNKEDIHWLTLFFYQHFEVDEILPFSYFEKVFNAHYSNIQLTPHGKEVLSDPVRYHNALRQLYASFNRWTGKVYSPLGASTKNNTSAHNRQANRSKRLLLIFHQQLPCFYEENKETESSPRKLSASEICTRKNRQWIDGNTLFFHPMEYFEDEYEASRFFYSDKSCYILIDTTIDSVGSRYLERSCNVRFEITGALVLYRFEPGKMPFPRCFVKHEGLQLPVLLTGGLRVGRKREYLAGFGPSITSLEQHLVFQQNKRVDYVPEQAKPGTYVVRVAGIRDTTFTILTPVALTEKISAIDYGWNIPRCSPEQNPTIEGCVIHIPMGRTAEDLTRQWINRLIAPERKPYRGHHSLLRMLNHIEL